MEIKTNEGRLGGILDGDFHSAPSGGIKAVVTDDNNRPVLLEKNEIVINKRSSKLFCEELSEINQAGGGIPINCKEEMSSDNYKNGGSIEQSKAEKLAEENILQPFIDIIKESKSFEDAFVKSKEVKGVQQNVSKYFYKTYNPDRSLSQEESFRKLYNEIKGNSKTKKIPAAVTKPTVGIDNVIEIDSKSFEPYKDMDELRDKAREYLKKYWRSDKDSDCIINFQTGFNICFFMDGIDKITNKKIESKLKSLSEIKKIIEYGKLTNISDDIHKEKNTIAVYRFMSFIRYNEELFDFSFIVKHKIGGIFLYEGDMQINKPLISYKQVGVSKDS